VHACGARVRAAASRHPAQALAATLLLGLLCVTTIVSCQRRTLPTAQLAPVPASEPEIRVRIRERVLSATVSGQRAVIVRVHPLGGDRGTATIVPTALTVTRERGQWKFAQPDGTPVLVRVERDDRIELTASSGPLNVDGAEYPGFVTLHSRARTHPGTFDIVAQLPMEPYVAGVIARELYGSWDADTFRAQAVAARSYGLHERSRARADGRHFDVESTTRDQVFGGSAQIDVAVRAAADTRGYVLLSGPNLLRAYYSSTCGGRAADANRTWPSGRGFEFNNAPPIQASIRPCDCSNSALHRWTRERSRAELSARLDAWARDDNPAAAGLGRIDRVTVHERNRAGRPGRYEITDTRGRSVVIRAEALRLALNHRAEGFPRISRTTRVPSGDVEVTRVGETFTIRGRGFGHGVGMCQFGAQQRAAQGDPWRSILAHYYPGAEAEKLYP
jgi:stage II sporulation protein D